MNCFNYIAKKLTNVDKVDNICNDELILQINFEIFFNVPYSIKKKFMFYHNINKNSFFTREQCNGFNQKFSEIQRVCAGFQKFAYLYKYKKAPIVVDTDICLNKINITDKNVMCIFQNNFKYLFHVFDLIKITNYALTHSDSFFAEPKPLKNPYNNMPFSKSNLYNIYFYIKYNTTLYSDLLLKYFDVNFNLTEFTSKYEYILREHSIENYVNKSSINILFVEALRMFSEYNNSKYNKFRIDVNFPKEVLVKIMKPYLFLHVQSLYSLVQTKKTRASLTLKKKLLALYTFNSNFGRKILYKETKHGFGKSRVIYKHYFESKHLSFHKHSKDFLSSHTTLNHAYDDDNGIQQIMNAFEYTVYNVEIYADEIDEEETDNEEAEANEPNTDEPTVDNGTVDDETDDDDSQEPDDNSVS
jgi:hypothetical protein